MSDRSSVIAKARSQVGYQRKPSRWNKYAAEVYPTVQNQAYCGVFAAWVIVKATGADVRKVCWLPFVPSIEAWARKHGAWKTSGQKDGDLVVFGFGKSSAQHVGFSWRDEESSSYRSVEGNTSSGNRGSQGNGGGVHVRYRSRSQIRGWVDLDKMIAAAGGAKTSSPSTNVWDTSARVKGMSKAEVKSVQALLVGAGYSVGKSGVDGSYKGDTVDAVKKAQKAFGVTVDGVAGPDTLAALKKAQKATSKPVTPAPAKPKAPAFPLPRKKGALYYYGLASGPKTSVSGQTRNSAVPGDVVQVKGRWMSKGLALFQAQLIKRGWSELKKDGPDGRFGKTTEKVVRQFQKVAGLKVDGQVGPATWAAAWEEPVK